jgi:transposase InsO family protein
MVGFDDSGHLLNFNSIIRAVGAARTLPDRRRRRACPARAHLIHHVLLRREGWGVNAKRIYRLYKELGLQLRNKTPKRRVKAQLRDDRRPAVQAHETWAMDFVHDQLATGRKIRVLTVVDTFSRFSPAIEPRFSFRAPDVIEVLERAGREHGFPKTIRVDQGTEFVSRDLDLWAYQRGVTLDYSRPGKPTDNAFTESLKGKFRAENVCGFRQQTHQTYDNVLITWVVSAFSLSLPDNAIENIIRTSFELIDG